MKISTYGLIIYFGLAMFYKLYAHSMPCTDVLANRDANYYWLFSSAFNSILAFELSKNFFIRMYRLIWMTSGTYWGVMFLVHLICVFNIELYSRFVSSANKITVGATFIMLALIFLTFKAFKKYDKNSEG